MKVSVFGMGYVGSVSAICLAALDHYVIGTDLNTTKVKMLNMGQSPVIEPGLAELLTDAKAKNRIHAVTSAMEAVLASDVSLVCVGTPGTKNGGLDLTYIQRVCREIAETLTQARGYHVIVVRSTLLPGSTEKIVIPILEKFSRLKAGRDFGVCYCPEFLREGSAVHDFQNPPFTILGEYDKKGASITAALFKDINSSIQIVSLKTAEMIKYVCNVFHALKVVFANEVGNICKKEELDSRQIMNIFCMDQVLNLSPNYLKPGFAFGGSCLTKDLRALLQHTRELGLNLPVLEGILPSNVRQIEIAAEMINKTAKKKVGLLGLSFKAGTDDLRESPLVELARKLLDEGYQIRIYDELVFPSRLIGANKAYIEQKIPQLSSLLCRTTQELLESCEVIVIGRASDEMQQILQKKLCDQFIIDLIKIKKSQDMAASRYQGICW